MALHPSKRVSVLLGLPGIRPAKCNDTSKRELSGRRTPRRLDAALALLLALFAFIAPHDLVNAATAPSLGTAQSFAVLGAASVTNTGPTMIGGGNLGVGPGLAITGFPPGIVNPPGTVHAGDAVALQAQSDATIAYNNLAGQPCTSDLTGQDLGGLTLIPGVYCFSSSAQLTGILTLDAQGNAGAVFIFKTGSTLTTASNSAVRVINGGSVCNVYWQIGSSATLGTNTAFVGNLLALASITLNTGATLSGRALARTGSVTLDSNAISSAGCTMLVATATPTPTSTATPIATPIPTATAPAATQTAIAATPTVIAATQTAPAATQTAIAATQTAPAATQTVIAATQTVIAVTQTAPAATQTVIAATQTVIAVTQTAPAATQMAIAATQTVIAVTQTAPAATQMAIAATQTVVAKSTAATTPTTTPRAVSPVRTPATTSMPYRVPPNGAPSNGLPFNGIVPYPGQAPIGPVGVALSTPVIVGSIPTPTAAVAATQTPTSVPAVSTAVPTAIATASATAISTAAPTQIATATVMIPNRLPRTGGGGLATTFTETTDTHRGVDAALWITLVVFLTLMRVCFLRVRRARR